MLILIIGASKDSILMAKVDTAKLNILTVRLLLDF